MCMCINNKIFVFVVSSNVLISRIFYCLMNNDTHPKKYNNPHVSHVEKNII
jgi:hypothetical protein